MTPINDNLSIKAARTISKRPPNKNFDQEVSLYGLGIYIFFFIGSNSQMACEKTNQFEKPHKKEITS